MVPVDLDKKDHRIRLNDDEVKVLEKCTRLERPEMNPQEDRLRCSLHSRFDWPGSHRC